MIGKIEDARVYLEQALALRLQALGEHHPETIYSLYTLGLLLAPHDQDNSLTYFQRALKICKEEFSTEYPLFEQIQEQIALLI